MEKQPNQEEKIEKNFVFQVLTENGDTPATQELVDVWVKQQENLVKTGKDRIIFYIDRADLYVAIMDIDKAKKCFEDALIQARQENEVELQKEIERRLKSFE